MIRKGTRALQQLPASPDAFVWLRLYQAQLARAVPTGRDQPLWWTLRRPFRALTYHAARAMFARANAALGANWSLHDLRHTAAYRMARDPQMPLTDVQWVLGHAHLSTTQMYLTPPVEDMIAAVVAHHARRASAVAAPASRLTAALRYRPSRWTCLFGTGPHEHDQGRQPPLRAAAAWHGADRTGPAPGRRASQLMAGSRPGAVAGLGRRPGRRREQVLARLFDRPVSARRPDTRLQRRRGLLRVLDWLGRPPGDSWQDRWLASGADAHGNAGVAATPCTMAGSATGCGLAEQIATEPRGRREPCADLRRRDPPRRCAGC